MTDETPDSSAPWSLGLAIQVAEAYRRNCEEGTPEPAAWHRIRDAYLAAGGDPKTAATAPNTIIAALCRVHPDWMHGPAKSRLEREASEPGKGTMRDGLRDLAVSAALATLNA